MDANKALKAHRAWKDRFRVAMAKREQMDVARIGADCHCDFGKWLHGEGKQRFGHAARYAQCVTDHAAFHVEAAKVAEAVNAGRLLDAEKMLAFGTTYAKASETLSMTVVAMFKEADGK